MLYLYDRIIVTGTIRTVLLKLGKNLPQGFDKGGDYSYVSKE